MAKKDRTIEKTLYQFKENHHQVFSHDLRVYIFGQDVSRWLKGELSVTYGNRDAYNTCSFDLANPHKLWQLTYDNLNNIWRTAPGEYSESVKQGIFAKKNDPNINPWYTLSTTATALGNNKKPSIPWNYERRYRLYANDCIFSKHDPIRVFMRNPINGWGNSNEGMWVEIFCGFIQDHPFTTNYVTGESSLRITCYDIRQLMKKMRVQINAYRHPNDVSPYFNDSFFADFRRPSLAKHPFTNKSLEQTIKELILGTATPTEDIPAFLMNGVGEFKIGNIVCYDAESADAGTTLENWHLMTLFGVNKVAYPTANDDLWLTESEMSQIGMATTYEPEKYAGGPEGRYLHFLLPYSGTGAGTLVQTTVDVNIQGVEWTTRWDIIREFAEKLDFQVLVSPSGDILVEFPMYGFTPKAFTEAGSAQPQKANKQRGSESIYDPPSKMETIFTFDKHQIEETMSDEAEDFPNVLQVDGGMANESIQTQGDAQIAVFRSFVYCPALVARYGVITEQHMIPFAGQNAAEMGPVLTERLARLGAIEFMRRMADSSHWEGSVVFRPFLFPNRPVWLRRAARIGVLTSVTNRWDIGKSAGTSFACHMLMAEQYDPDTGDITYKLPTGATNTPIDYAGIWIPTSSDKTYTKENSNVRVNTGKQTPSTTANDGSPGSTGSDTKPQPVPAPNVKDMPGLYPKFQEKFQEALNEAAGKGMEIEVTDGFRAPENQTALRKMYLNNEVSYQPEEVVEFTETMHEYGLAVDIYIVGENYGAFAEIAEKYDIAWGRSSNPMHFEYAKMTKEQGKNIIARDTKNKAAPYNAIWEFLEKNKETPTTSENPIKAFFTSDAEKAKQKSSGTEVPSPAPDCEEKFLSSPGLTKLK